MTTTIDLDDLLTTKEAATLLGLKYGTLEIWRSTSPTKLSIRENANHFLPRSLMDEPMW